MSTITHNTTAAAHDRPVPLIDPLLAAIGWGLFYRPGLPLTRWDAWTDATGARTWHLGRLELVRDPR